MTLISHFSSENTLPLTVSWSQTDSITASETIVFLWFIQWSRCGKIITAFEFPVEKGTYGQNPSPPFFPSMMTITMRKILTTIIIITTNSVIAGIGWYEAAAAAWWGSDDALIRCCSCAYYFAKTSAAIFHVNHEPLYCLSLQYHRVMENDQWIKTAFFWTVEDVVGVSSHPDNFLLDPKTKSEAACQSLTSYYTVQTLISFVTTQWRLQSVTTYYWSHTKT